MVGHSDFYMDDVCPIDLMEYVQDLGKEIGNLRERIMELEKARILKFRLPEGYLDEEPEDDCD